MAAALGKQHQQKGNGVTHGGGKTTPAGRKPGAGPSVFVFAFFLSFVSLLHSHTHAVISLAAGA